MKLYMAVTQDRYQLPIAISETAVGLARLTGDTPNNVYSTISKGIKGVLRNPRYIRVEIEDDDGETSVPTAEES